MRLYIIVSLAFIVSGCSILNINESKSEGSVPKPIIVNFGTQGEPNAFDRSHWSRFRNKFTLQGIVTNEFEFTRKLGQADWHLFLWMETGFEDSVTTRFSINGESVNPNFMPFNPPAELPANPQRLMRFFQHPVTLVNGDFELKLTGVDDSVRVLAVILVPDGKNPVTPKQQDIYSEIQKLGHFQATESVEEVLKNLREMGENPINRNFALFWGTQLDWFHTAETYFYYRGWERLRPITSLSLFEHLHQSVMYLDGVLNTPDASENPLFERALWLRGRTLWWLDLERGGKYEKVYAMSDLSRMLELQPADSLVRMYNGEKLRTQSRADQYKRPAGAPDWSWKQFEILNRLGEIAEYWVSIQDSVGEMGGKLGDDVEILRWWPILVASGHETAMQGWKVLADGVWNSRHIHLGYARRISDVEHASEFIADTAPNMILFSDDPEYTYRLGYSAAHLDTLWTAVNDHGRRFFKSTWFSSTEMDLEEPKNRDVPFNARATKAARYYAWKTGDERTIKLLSDWSMAWVHAALRTDKGKPKGIIPPSIRFHDEAINGDEPTWHIANMFWDYYDWDGGDAMIDQQVFMWTLTGNDSMLIPMKLNLDLIRKYHKSDETSNSPEGSEAWAAGILRDNADFWSTVGEWRLQSGDKTYDDLILAYGAPYTRYRISGNISHLDESFDLILGTIRYNIQLLTTDAVHTDRIYISPHRSGADDQIKAMITGDQSPENASPYTPVTWAKTDSRVTMLITGHSPSSLKSELFSYDRESRTIQMKPWQLKPGKYRLTVNQNVTVIDITHRGQPIPVNLLPETLTKVELRKL